MPTLYFSCLLLQSIQRNPKNLQQLTDLISSSKTNAATSSDRRNITHQHHLQHHPVTSKKKEDTSFNSDLDPLSKNRPDSDPTSFLGRNFASGLHFRRSWYRYDRDEELYASVPTTGLRYFYNHQEMMSSMQYNMGQMMFPDTQRYLQTMGFMGMVMGMPSAAMQRPVMPFGTILPYPPVLGQSPANLRPQLMPSFHPSNVAIPDQVRLEASNQQDPASSSINVMGPNMVQIPNFTDPYHNYAPLPRLQISSQGQKMDETGTSKTTDNTKKSTG